MNEPRNKDNFLIEVTPEVLGELRQLYRHSDDDPVAELHYSPYWIKTERAEVEEASEDIDIEHDGADDEGNKNHN